MQIMSAKANTDLPDILASLKRIVADGGNASKEVAVSNGNGTLILEPSF